MLKTISISSLRPGMFMHALDGRWFDHPFWKSSFLLSAQDIKKLAASGVESVVIDTDKGLIKDEDEAKPDLSGVAHPQPGENANEKAIPVAVLPPRKSVADEIGRAKQIFGSACDEMKLVFRQARLGKAVSMPAMLSIVENVAASLARNPYALTSVARLKQHDLYTHMHSVATCALMTALATVLGHNEQSIAEAGIAGLLHDIGKAVMPLDVINKPGKLSPQEFEIAKKHPKDGWAMLHSIDLSADVLDVVLLHHEKFDGSGYPQGLSGAAIPLLARMGAICDVYDAVTSERSYKAAWHPTVALRNMSSWEGHFDKSIFASFVRTVGIYPVGVLVRLESGFLAVVLDQNETSLCAPIVKTFFSLKTNQPTIPRVVDLGKHQADRIVAIEDQKRSDLSHMTELWLNHVAA